MGEAASRLGVQSVSRACSILFALADRPYPLSAAELAAVTGLNRTVAYRILRTLESEGLVHEHSRRFSLGELSLRLGQSYLEGLGFYRSTLAYAILVSTRFLADRPWVVSLAVPVGDEVALVDRLWGPGAPLDIVIEIGRRLPMPHTALGRAILAFLPEERARATVGDLRYEEIASILEEVRRDGVSFCDGEIMHDVAAVGAPIRNHQAEPVAAICVSGTDFRAHLHPGSEVAEHVRSVAEDLSRELLHASGSLLKQHGRGETNTRM